MSPMKVQGKTIDGYLAKVSADKRVALNKLRKAIKTVVPKAEECISYGVPAFRLDGRFLVAFCAAAKHCSFFPGSTPIEVHKSALKSYGLSKGTIRFPADKPLPLSLVRKLVKVRVAQVRD